VRPPAKAIEFKQKRKLGNKRAEKWYVPALRARDLTALGSGAPFATVRAKTARRSATGSKRATSTSVRALYQRPVRLTRADYKFAKFNKPCVVLEYSKEQYDAHFQDPDWSKDETDYLLAQCRLFDCRFIVIHDRWQRTRRTVEDLKERFYAVQRRLLQLDAQTPADHPLLKYPFNRGTCHCLTPVTRPLTAHRARD
jgi:hypothetical protein